MKKAMLSVIAACASLAEGQTGVRYRLEAVSALDAEFCMGPCLCPYHHQVGPLGGVFTLTLVDQNPLFRDYRVSSVDWASTIAFGTLRFTGSGTYRIGGEVAITHQMQLALSENGEPPVGYNSGVVGIDTSRPLPRIGIAVPSKLFGCRVNNLEIYAYPVACYADCDGSGQLNVTDFSCFLNLFAAGDPYANCDGGSVPPTLNVADFACFLNGFASGCP